MPSESPIEPQYMGIPAHSRRQAMDWSLVLASQAIENVIVRNDSGWELLVAVDQYEHALTTIRQYRYENRHWSWQRQVFKGGLIFDWASLSWVSLLIFFAWLAPAYDLKGRGILDTAAVTHGQWWRIFTAVWLHADAEHLATNAAIGLVLLGLTMGRFGTGTGLFGAYLAGVSAYAIECAIPAEAHYSLGASGMVMGSLGILATQSLFLWRIPYGRRYLVSAVAAGLMLFILLGLAPGTDIVAHFGGFVVGFVVGGLLSLRRSPGQKCVLNFMCGIAFIMLVIVPWWKALNSGP
jgi:membrane associated rhomboid family serine protease